MILDGILENSNSFPMCFNGIPGVLDGFLENVNYNQRNSLELPRISIPGEHLGRQGALKCCQIHWNMESTDF